MKNGKLCNLNKVKSKYTENAERNGPKTNMQIIYTSKTEIVTKNKNNPFLGNFPHFFPCGTCFPLLLRL